MLIRRVLALVLCLATLPALAAQQAIYVHTALFEAEDAAPDAIATAMDTIAACGFDTIYPYATTSSGTSFYPSAILESTRAARPDTLGDVARAARERGLRVVPAVCVLSSGHHTVRGPAAAHPAWALRTPDGEAMGWLSPAHPLAREHVVTVVREVLDHTGADGILLDYLRFPNEAVQLDPESALRFSLDAPEDESAEARAARLQHFKEQALSRLTAEISATVFRAKPDAVLGVYTWGPHVPFDHRVAQRWPDWVQAGYINLVNVSGYCYPENYGEAYLDVFAKRLQGAADLIQASGKDVPLTFALGIKTSHGAISSTQDIRDYLRIARGIGVQGTAVFSWTHFLPYVERARTERIFLEAWP